MEPEDGKGPGTWDLGPETGYPNKGHGTRGWEGTWDQRLGYLRCGLTNKLLPSVILRMRAVINK